MTMALCEVTSLAGLNSDLIRVPGFSSTPRSE
jgi:hypothetical protein